MKKKIKLTLKQKLHMVFVMSVATLFLIIMYLAAYGIK